MDWGQTSARDAGASLILQEDGREEAERTETGKIPVPRDKNFYWFSGMVLALVALFLCRMRDFQKICFVIGLAISVSIDWCGAENLPAGSLVMHGAFIGETGGFRFDHFSEVRNICWA